MTGRETVTGGRRPGAGAWSGHDWRDTVRGAADLALLGIGVTVAALPVVTAGAALAAGSMAARHWCTHACLPPTGVLLREFARHLLPGVLAGPALVTTAALLVVDVSALRSGAAPGGPAMLAAVGLVCAALVAFAALVLVALGREPAAGWRTAIRWAVRGFTATPLAAAALAGVLTLAGVLAALIPLTAPLALGYTLFALHTVAARLAPEPR